MNELKGNSNASKEHSKLEKVTTNVTIKENKKKNSFWKYFFVKDAKEAVFDVNKDIIMPGIKSLIVNILHGAVNTIFGSSGNRPYSGTSYTSYGSSPIHNVSYNQAYDANKPIGVQQTAQQTKIQEMYDVSNVIFDSRGEAEEVLSRMIETINRYGSVSVSDFYDLIGQNIAFTADKYGWRDLSTGVVQNCLSGGYRLLLPNVIPLQ